MTTPQSQVKVNFEFLLRYTGKLQTEFTIKREENITIEKIQQVFSMILRKLSEKRKNELLEIIHSISQSPSPVLLIKEYYLIERTHGRFTENVIIIISSGEKTFTICESDRYISLPEVVEELLSVYSYQTIFEL